MLAAPASCYVFSGSVARDPCLHIVCRSIGIQEIAPDFRRFPGKSTFAAFQSHLNMKHILSTFNVYSYSYIDNT